MHSQRQPTSFRNPHHFMLVMNYLSPNEWEKMHSQREPTSLKNKQQKITSCLWWTTYHLMKKRKWQRQPTSLRNLHHFTTSYIPRCHNNVLQLNRIVDKVYPQPSVLSRNAPTLIYWTDSKPAIAACPQPHLLSLTISLSNMHTSVCTHTHTHTHTN